MNRFSEPYSVLILDNASIHKGQYLKWTLCEEKGVILELLPAYAPDYNHLLYYNLIILIFYYYSIILILNFFNLFEIF